MRTNFLIWIAPASSLRWALNCRIAPLIVGGLLSFCLSSATHSQEICDTAFGRIAKRAFEKAVAAHQGDACAGLKKGPFAIDKTKALELRSFSFCETGAVVVASLKVRVRCTTSDQAMIQAEVDDVLTAKVSADLDTCQVLDADVTAGTFASQTGIRIADLKDKMRDVVGREIRDYCR